MESLFEISNKLIKSINTDFTRSLYNKIDWSQRLIEIKGARGVGKTTLMLQKCKELAQHNPIEVLYMTLDDSYFYDNTIRDVADKFSKYGGKYIFIDEVHKYPEKYKHHDWASELKNIYDLYPELYVIYSGSSIIEIYKGNGDLSRRKISYSLNGLSFREYLNFNKIAEITHVSIDDIFKDSFNISNEIVQKIKVLPNFKNYLKTGYYPFYNENPDEYYSRIKNIINVILEIDIPSVTEITFENIGKIKKMLSVLATSVPYTPNLTKLSKELNVADLRTLYKYLNFIEKAELISTIRSNKTGNKIFHKPEKIYLNNPNISYALHGNLTDIGTIRETFAYNQLNYIREVTYPEKGDMLINGKYLIEIGGKNKTSKQIKDTDNAFLVVDDIETGYGNKIPLWLLGLLY